MMTDCYRTLSKNILVFFVFSEKRNICDVTSNDISISFLPLMMIMSANNNLLQKNEAAKNEPDVTTTYQHSSTNDKNNSKKRQNGSTAQQQKSIESNESTNNAIVATRMLLGRRASWAYSSNQIQNGNHDRLLCFAVSDTILRCQYCCQLKSLQLVGTLSCFNI